MYIVWLDGRERISRNHMSGYRVSMTFEQVCGADLLITPLKAVISKATMQEHLDAGMVMIQIKHGRDLSASVIDQRLFEALMRMNSHDASPYQCGLLLTGKFENRKGHLYIDGNRSMITWSAFRGAWDAWVIRGGVVYPIIARNELQDFVDGLGNKLFVGDPFLQANPSRKTKKFKGEKKFTKGMTLSQKARLAGQGIDEHDLRHLLVNIDGLSSKTVQGIWTLMKEEKLDPNMGNFISLLTMDRLLNVKGIGIKVNNRIRRQLGYEIAS